MNIADAIRRFKQIVDEIPDAANWDLVMPDMLDIVEIEPAPYLRVVIVTDEDSQ